MRRFSVKDVAFSFALTLACAATAVADWECQYQGTPGRLLGDVHFCDGQNGFCVGFMYGSDPAAILKTTDGGENWSIVDPGVEQLGHAWAVYMADPQTIWIAGGDCGGEEHGWILRTDNGGGTWDQQIHYWTLPWTRFYGLHFVDHQHGWASVAGHNASVYRTTNGGASWVSHTPAGLDGSTYLPGVHFEDEMTGWVVGGHENPLWNCGVIFRTDDGGVTWAKQGSEIQSTLDGVCLYDVWFVDHQKGWAVGGAAGSTGGIILHTDNGGATWQVQTFQQEPHSVRLGSVCFVDELEGWVAGAEYGPSGGPAIYHTTDGGQTWSSVPGVGMWPLEVPFFNGIHFADHLNGWIVGSDMRIVKYSGSAAISVLSPPPGATWWIADAETVQWSSCGTSGLVRVEICRDGASWVLLAGGLQDWDGGSFQWTVQGPPSDDCVIRVVDMDGFPEGYSGVFAIAEPSLALTLPEGGDVWWVADTQQIRWASAGTSGMVEIELSRDGGTSWSDLASCVADSGAFAWDVSGPPSATCVVRVTDCDGYPGGTSAPFTIAEPTIEVLAPSPDDLWWVGDTLAVQWMSAGTSGAVNIDVSRDDGISWSSVASRIADSGRFFWEVAGPPSHRCVIRVADCDGFPVAVSGVFTIDLLSAMHADVPSGLDLAVIGRHPSSTRVGLRCCIPHEEYGSLAIYDLSGRLVTKLFEGPFSAGEHVLWWSPENPSPRPLQGVFVARLEFGDRRLRTPFVILP